jgi:hypothetical protein
LKRLVISSAAAIFALVTAGTASAATVIGAHSVTITKALSTYLQVSEVEAFNFSNVDVALGSNGASATAPDQYTGTDPNGPSGPNNAIDGVGPDAYGAIYHSVDVSGSLTVTFNGNYDLASLSVFGRTDCCSERDAYNVTIKGANGQTLYAGMLDARNNDHVGTATFDAPTGGVPEPASWSLMLVGFGGLGAVLRRRRGQVGLTA